MSQKAKLLLGIAGFALLLVGAVVAYNALSEQAPPDADLPTVTGFTTTQSQVQPQEPETEQSQPPTGPEIALTQTQINASWSGADFTVTDAAGISVKLSDMGGRPVVLNFWASWCSPCRQEMPEFDKLHKELGGEIVFMMVDLTDGARETVATAEKFIRDSGYGFPVYFDTQGRAADAYSIRSIPATFFIDGSGKVVSSQVGALSEAALRRGIEGIR